METSPEFRPIILDDEIYKDLKDIIETLLSESHEDLLGDEDEEATEHTITGERRELSIRNGRVVVARYEPDEREYVARELATNLGVEIEKPYGHIEAYTESDGTTFACGIYLADEKRAVGVFACEFKDGEEVLLPASEACYRFAYQLGLDAVWVDHMYSGNTKQELQRDLTNRQVRDLTEFLQNIVEITSG
jgi:hypothetical protein